MNRTKQVTNQNKSKDKEQQSKLYRSILSVSIFGTFITIGLIILRL